MTELIEISVFKKKAKTRYVLNIVIYALIMALALTGAILLLLLSNLDYYVNMIIDIVLCSVMAIGSIFYFSNIFPIVRHYYAYYRDMNEVALEDRQNMVFIEEQGTKTINNVKYRNLLFSYHEKQETYLENVYVLDNDTTFRSEHRYKLKTYHNVIIKFEESAYAEV